LLKFRVPLIDDKERKPIISLVNQILAAKKKDPNADTSALEKQIDELVYKLYGLTPEEIAIVEGKGKSS
jgi:type II restriction/modification system DNA methylase subunit YeeA